MHVVPQRYQELLCQPLKEHLAQMMGYSGMTSTLLGEISVGHPPSDQCQHKSHLPHLLRHHYCRDHHDVLTSRHGRHHHLHQQQELETQSIAAEKLLLSLVLLNEHFGEIMAILNVNLLQFGLNSDLGTAE